MVLKNCPSNSRMSTLPPSLKNFSVATPSIDEMVEKASFQAKNSGSREQSLNFSWKLTNRKLTLSRNACSFIMPLIHFFLEKKWQFNLKYHTRLWIHRFSLIHSSLWIYFAFAMISFFTKMQITSQSLPDKSTAYIKSLPFS